ncbi:hypothetical protein TSAR_002234 [Trichomalopsis sarcophagae]|uniref:tRNA/rRNA methyltransferase SpoU type domain-containing protein n=1 Tax=Trichomalopsis sarcophagae TaxID=543379 RepID=A0A232FD00_9HYME|nr:hypothetical protein TSAR_002234 [Trichomalopsis sarcophagae]
MELHKHFMSIAELESSIFEIIGSTPILQESIDVIASKYIEDCFEALKSTGTSKKKLELLRFLLCQQYKLNYEHPRESKAKFQTKLNHFLEFLLNSKLYTQKENQSILNDVMVLQVVLFEDQKYFVKFFEDFRASCTADRTETANKLSIGWYLKMLNCFLSAWEVLNFLNDKLNVGAANKAHLECCKKVLLSSVMYDLQTWIQCNENNELRALHLLLSKVVTIAKNNRILSPYLHEILDKQFALTIICILCDFVFPIETSNMDVDYSLIHHANLWCMVQNKLVSEILQERKQALYLFKRLIDFIDLNEEKIKKTISLNLMPNKINPFICTENESSKLGIKLIRTNFVLIMEALEEKQKHLVIPSLSLVDSLIEGYREHVSCGNCFDFGWLYCIFARILKHDNNAVVKWGLLKSLKLNREVYYYDHFILLVVKTLNNTFLYEKNYEEVQPEIVTALTTWFNQFQSECLRLMEKFIVTFYESSWAPVPLFYILQSLSSTSDKLNNIVDLQYEELDVLRIVLDRNIKLHPPMLRTMSQVLLIKILSRFSQNPKLMDITKLLSVFSKRDIIEPCSWHALTSWLAKSQYNDTISFINQVCDELMFDDNTVGIKMSTFSIIIQALFEGGIICQSEQCSITQKLTTLFLCLDKIDIRPYVKVSLVVKIIDLFTNWFNLQHEVPAFVYKILINYKQTIFKFILKLFHNEDFDSDDILIFTMFLQNIEYFSNGKLNTICIVDSSNRKELATKCLQVLSNTNKHNKVQLLFALETLSNISNHYKYDNKLLLENIKDLIQTCKSQERSNEMTGEIASNYYFALSKLIKNHVKTLNFDDLMANDEWLKILSLVVDTAGNQVLIHFCDVIYQVSSAVVNDSEKLEELTVLTKSLWNCNFGSRRDKVFWLVSQKLTKCINSSNFLNSPCLKDVSEEFTSRMLSEGESLPVLKYILLIFSEIKQNFSYFIDIVLNGLLHGQVMRRDQRINMQTFVEAKKYLKAYTLKDETIDSLEVYEFINRQCNIDAAIRAAAVLQLIKALQNDNKNAALLLPLILKKLLAIQKKRYFADSQLHRLKHRLMQILLILQPYLDQQSTVMLYHTLRDSIVYDSDQHSVRLMKEWLLVRIYLSNRELLSDLWSFFEKICNERPGSASSIIGIIWHISLQLDRNHVSEFIKKALEKLGVCCMGQQFGIRLFGQVFFIKLYELLDENSDLRQEYANFHKSVLASLNCGNFKKNPIKIDEDFFYSTFNPIQHYTLETIYHQLPRLSNVSNEEWITKENFEEQLLLDNGTINFDIKNTDCSLNAASIPYSILKSNENYKPEEVECSENITDMQKKITPWKTMLPNEEELSEIADLSNYRKECNNKQDIVVVASLIEKSQNLGGIARTCEIFGVKQLVVSNLKQIEDKEFQVLSVSADKWIKIIEVKSFSLANYLLELKDCGWTLIGAEQTANSVNLYDLKYPKQTVLVLGNEKNGIPANIIPLLDMCVEISQFGVIRSLNVHVTSAICIWEYVKQYQFEP